MLQNARQMTGQGQQQLSSRRVQVRQRRCYCCGSVSHLAKDCDQKRHPRNAGPDVKCSKCGLRGHEAASCHVKCRKCGGIGHIAKNCGKSSVPSRRVVVGSTYHLDVTVCGHDIPAVIDSGSERTLLSRAMSEELGLQLRRTSS